MYFILRLVFISCVIYFRNVVAQNVSGAASDYIPSCTMPGNPENGVYTIGDDAAGTFKPGSSINAYSSLRVVCNVNYKPSPPDRPSSICVEGRWLPDPPQCSLFCDGRNSSESTIVSCSFKGRRLQSCTNPVEDTKAFITCEVSYENIKIRENPFRICKDGGWDRPFLQCNKVVITTTPLPPPTKCLMPDNPANGVYTIGNNSLGTFKPGTSVSAFSVLNVICNRNYNRFPPDHPGSVCVGGKWVAEPSQCSRACFWRVSSNTTKVSCTFNGRPQSCTNSVENTIATVACEHPYEDVSTTKSPLRCKDGSWDYPFPQCKPVCGLKRPHASPASLALASLVMGKMDTISDYPWHVGIYNSESNTLLCGGSILNQRVILSAAHCFPDYTIGEQFLGEKYMIAAGWNGMKFEQHAFVEYIYIPSRYRADVRYYEADLAVVVLKTNLELSRSVQPVCIDWQNAFEYQHLTTGILGLVLGWSHTREGDPPTHEGKEWRVLAIPYEQCFEEVPKTFRRFITYDKTCVKDAANDTTTYPGIGGGGLVFLDRSGRYYLRGILSTFPQNVNQYATCTLLSKHIDFIKLHTLI